MWPPSQGNGQRCSPTRYRRVRGSEYTSEPRKRGVTRGRVGSLIACEKPSAVRAAPVAPRVRRRFLPSMHYLSCKGILLSPSPSGCLEKNQLVGYLHFDVYNSYILIYRHRRKHQEPAARPY